ncbi:probable phospholipid hydroperoxide glutathione peroxidase [Selaginella moellendorffii]|uniref:probable phospholipid hydroperoxide glutathione peroxidase n=1 Tax=Selaginella moellendorffii TaxID=88036 RepID=UPI000D1C5112|nr:probable phospholipid hydroperoxide glutathione peroxidase [Selaginella moellendorffii]XP_024524472.1 probable phospholipid hydroperoxide glutathione peroxidase [Selaginella moellendorffii]|eukprot:XP_002960665.2 probable phospholipid hydroperoxide glutathione peroxidase [Selaginella moellendorffii]
MILRAYSSYISLVLVLLVSLYWRNASLFYDSARIFSPNYRNMSSSDKPSSIYDITVNDATGNDVSLGSYKDKVLLIVNVASQCGFTTTNYKELNELYEKYKDKGFEILAFPCNQFAGQEPGSNEEIQQTVCTRFKAEFPVFGKVNVNGADTAPVFKYLKSAKGGGIFGDFIKWNFSKFLVSKTGEVVERYAPTTNPSKIEKDILKLL